ncbi:hypothetical protein KIPB_015479, partial [Kipferlia bialata]
YRDLTSHFTTDWAVIGDSIHVIDTDATEETACHSSFNMATHKYTLHREMPFEVYNPAVISISHYLLVIGGLDHESTIHAYDTTTDTWA